MERCPDILPEELVAHVKQIGLAWATSPLRPRIAQDARVAWGALIDAWAQASDLPLLIRKHADNRGQILVHSSGRELIPADNSPAQWAFTMAINGPCPTLEGIRALVAQDKIPVAMVLKKGERDAAAKRCLLGPTTNLNRLGWKLGHFEEVGLNTRTSLTDIPFDLLIRHFRKFMMPDNMFVVPVKWAGLAEILEVNAEIRRADSPPSGPDTDL